MGFKTSTKVPITDLDNFDYVIQIGFWVIPKTATANFMQLILCNFFILCNKGKEENYKKWISQREKTTKNEYIPQGWKAFQIK